MSIEKIDSLSVWKPLNIHFKKGAPRESIYRFTEIGTGLASQMNLRPQKRSVEY